MENRERIVHFNSPEGEVWRYKTTEDELLEELYKVETNNKKHGRNNTSRNAQKQTEVL